MTRPGAALAPLALTPEEWESELRTVGARSFHGKQIFRWMHVRGVLEAERMTDLSIRLRESVARMQPELTYSVASERRSTDNTRKIFVRLRDGALVETVLIPGVSGNPGLLPSPVSAREEDADAAAASDDDEPDEPEPAGSDARVRVTQCVSTQVGCAMGCIFCASGVAGLKRNLGADEIVAQVVAGRARLEPDERLRNIVFMGMGEPLHNYAATARALRLLTHPEGVALSARRITVSTSGLVPEIAKLGEDFAGNIGLAVSLHAADDDTRSRLMPINRKYPLPVLMDALRAYPLPKRRRITIEYTLVAGRNDEVSEAKKVARLLRGLRVKIKIGRAHV